MFRIGCSNPTNDENVENNNPWQRIRESGGQNTDESIYGLRNQDKTMGRWDNIQQQDDVPTPYII